MGGGADEGCVAAGDELQDAKRVRRRRGTSREGKRRTLTSSTPTVSLLACLWVTHQLPTQPGPNMGYALGEALQVLAERERLSKDELCQRTDKVLRGGHAQRNLCE